MSHSPRIIADHHYLSACRGFRLCSQYSHTAGTSISLPIGENITGSTPLLSNTISSMRFWWLGHFVSQAHALTRHNDKIEYYEFMKMTIDR